MPNSTQNPSILSNKCFNPHPPSPVEKPIFSPYPIPFEITIIIIYMYGVELQSAVSVPVLP